jgi:tRNA-2-methylthio-N6-dimethylallyladenosine synthase
MTTQDRTYHIWTVGCQMNVADSEQLGSELEALGYQAVEAPEAADVVVVNSCVVRQHAEDRVSNKLYALRAAKAANPDQVVALMGCMVGPRTEDLRKRFPHVDVFMRPQVFDGLIQMVQDPVILSEAKNLEGARGRGVKAEGPTAFVNVIHGCDNFCTFCIVPYRRGRERSRPVPEIRAEVEALVAQGVREVTLLGQKVDSYGKDFADGTDLADLLAGVHEVDGLERIRFLTSYPLGVTDKLVETMARLPKVCEHVNIPVQSGDDAVLTAMHRGYTVAQFRDRIDRIRAAMPEASLSTDIITGFCGETEPNFQRTLDLLEEMRFDVVHVAAYSERPGTIAARTLPDDVPLNVKKERLHRVEELQEGIARELNVGLTGRTESVLVETQRDGRWEGRTRTNKLVHFEGPENLSGALVEVRITNTSPWSLQADYLRSDR